MNNKQFVEKLLEVKNKYKTYYATGTFGQKATDSFINQKAKQYPKQYTVSKVNKLKALPDDTRLFDCVGLIKGVLWGFPNTVYTSNGVPDVNDSGIYKACYEKSKDFSKIEVGELLHMSGHVGVYIGNGKAIECTAAWMSNVQITAVANIGYISGLNSRKWTEHGKLPYISYGETIVPEEQPEKPKKDISKYPILRKGSTGKYVTELQTLLVGYGYDPKGIDGIFGPGCLAAVKKFQQDKKLVVDGCVGPKTWGALYGQ